jgi:hypothetical protein
MSSSASFKSSTEQFSDQLSFSTESSRTELKRKADCLLPISTVDRLSNPEPLSINGIIRQHCGRRLYVSPLHWTTAHLQFLNCRFTRGTPSANSTGKPPSQFATRGCDISSQVKRRISHAKFLVNHGDKQGARQAAMVDLIEAYNMGSNW